MWHAGAARENGEFEELFIRHGIEVRGKPFELDRARITNLAKQGRLVWVVARSDFGTPVGYQLSFWYRNLHWNEREATDDMWFVTPSCRGKGVGTLLKVYAHTELKRLQVVRVYDNIREGMHNALMSKIGFENWGTRWVKTL